MPELPEVETIRRGLEKYIVGKKIGDFEIKDSKLLQSQQIHLAGEKVIAVRRFGKGLVIDLSSNFSIAIHIKMTGQLVYRDKNTNNKLGLPTKHTRAIFIFTDASRLFFNDIRRFGWIKILKTTEVPHLSFFKNLGPEPFKDLTPNYLQKICEKYNLPIKALIMNQNKISGVGNIYANDALNLARLSPLRKAKTLSKKETNKLYLSILEVLNRGLKFGGSSEVNYVNADGKQGKYQEHSLVYNREGKKCYNCGRIIKKVRIAGRGTYFCTNCQV
ncbi:DNA-formamidopyrimidine glycosylase [Candidatus Roizmanbacteria bacterium RIFCSPLOWO2_01_FULL_37_12]|uniref:DNA-formamidopyrimidine glycosylase n=1 Tax=Candidatus Roizmanbacteria bacterium RIFCSPLOWO2_01_FULL_37_12 TaxID=1802056 RepID=A0A1F7IE12_9BACT|nr:MAG: DNA-formamidopyrimidine glycosylase [Candidatus Roizmanbacteria bacterium RIFCSPHIGHO2_02_FULL_37_9b]OGK41598.1 MAG: DNA-formamidopyrimidine glycosylase [Candidatus Roizmanbacteria bacterium RIFCSPLOWO2_01_FULL_37_12]